MFVTCRYNFVAVHSATSTAGGLRATLIGRGFRNTTQLECRFGTNDPVPAMFFSSTEISCPTPDPPVDMTPVVVEATVNGMDFSADGTLFSFPSQPFVVSLHPAAGPMGGGTSVLLSGAHFFDSQKLGCKFGALLVSARWLSETLVRCESPSWPTYGTTFVEVTINGRDFTSDRNTFSFYRNRVLGVVPSIIPTYGDTLLSIIGEGFVFSGDYFVRMGDTELEVTFVSSSELECVAPQVAEAGEVNVSVISEGVNFGDVPGVMLTYIRPVSIAYIEPQWGLQSEGATVVLQGNGFTNTTQLTCTFGRHRLALAAAFMSESNVSCTVPPGTPRGVHSIEISVDGLEFTASSTPFVVVGEPTILSVSPVSGPHSGGTAVRVKGVDIGNSFGLGCLFGATAVVGRWESSTSVWCTTPPGNEGESVRVAITLDGFPYSSSSLHFLFWDSLSHQCASGSVYPSEHAVDGALWKVNPGASMRSDERIDSDFAAQAQVQGIWKMYNDTSPGCISTGSQRLLHETRTVYEIRGREANMSTENTAIQFRDLREGGDDVGSPVVDIPTVILRIAPDYGSQDGGTKVLVIGATFVDSDRLACRFGESQVPGRWLSPVTVSCTSPRGEGNTTVVVDVISDGVASVSKSVFFRYQANPTATELRPSSGWVQGGTLVSIHGHSFESSSSLTARFGRTSVPVAFVSPTELRTTSPSHSAGSVDVSVGDSEGLFFGKLDFLYREAPTIFVLYPSSGSTTGGFEVKIRGQGFVNSGTLACRFGHTSIVPAVFVSDEEMECIAPPAAEPGRVVVEITVNAIDYTSDGNFFTYTLAPVLLFATPDSGSASGGTAVLLEGVNFVDSRGLMCKFGESMVAGQWISSTMVQCISPTGKENTISSLIITYGEGHETIGHLDFYYYHEPILERISPTDGRAMGRKAISIFGKHFWFSGDIRVRFGSTSVPATFVSPSELRCEAPPLSPGSFYVSISFNGIDFTEARSSYFYTVHPKVTGMSSSKTALEGTSYTNSNVSSSTNVPRRSCVSGEGHMNTGSLSGEENVCAIHEAPESGVSSGGMTSNDHAYAAGRYIVNYTGSPYVSSAYPNTGPYSGGTSVLVGGYNFEDVKGLRCLFGLQYVFAHWVSSTKVRCVSPSVRSPRVVRLALVVEGRDEYLSGTPFTYYTEPVVSGLSPIAGSSDGGTVVSLVGANFTFTPKLKAMFGLMDVPVTFLNSSLLRCVTRASPVSNAEVSIGINGRDSKPFNAVSYSFRSGLGVTSVMPSRGSVAGGTLVSVRGSGFHDATQPTCRFGTLEAHVVHATLVSPNEMLCRPPSTTEVGSYPVEISVNGFDFSRSGNSFTYHRDPFVTSGRRTHSDVDGMWIFVQGGHFVDSDSIICHFGTSVETSGRWVSSTLIVCLSPSASTISQESQETAMQLAVSFNGQEQTASIDFHLEALVSVANWNLGVGSTRGGTLVIFRGTSFIFNGDIRARFGKKVVPVTFISPQELRCVSPTGDLGGTEVTLMVENTVYTNSFLSFEYVPDVTVNTTTIDYTAATNVATAVLRGKGFRNTSQLACRFGTSTVAPAIFSSTSEVSCVVPASVDLSSNSLEVTVDGEFFTVAEVHPEFERFTSLVVTPSSGPEIGGTTVEIRGRRFAATDEVTCVFGETAQPAVWLSEQAIQCEAPMLEEQAARVTVSVIVEGNSSPETSYFQYTWPSISAISPGIGEDSGGTVVDVTGKGFDVDTQWYCCFGRAQSRALVIDARGRRLQCLSPPNVGMGGSVNLSVSSGPGRSSLTRGIPFTYIPALQAVSLKPASGSTDGGATVVATVRHGFGTNRPPVECAFGTVGVSTATWLNETAITCAVPSSQFRGQVLVNIYSSSNTERARGNMIPFWYFYTPTVSFVYPLEVLVGNNAPTAVTITGGNFEGTGDLACLVGTVLTKAQWVSDSLMKCPLDGIAPGEYDIAVSNNMVDFVSARVTLRVILEESVAMTRITPGVGTTRGNSSVEVFGPGVGLLAPGRYCLFENVAVNATSLSENRVECLTTAHGEGGVSVRVCDYQGTCTLAHRHFLYVNVPLLLGLSPDGGSIHGGTLVTAESPGICGEVGRNVWCKVGKIVRLASSVKENSVVCATPPGQDGFTNVAVSCNGHDFSAPLPFRYRRDIFVYDVSPPYVSVSGESIVHIRGKGFQNVAQARTATLNMLCVFDEKYVAAVWVSEALVLCRAPRRGPGVALLQVFTSTGQEVASTNLTYIAASHREEYVLSPNAGPTDGGTEVSIVGKYANMFVDVLLCKFGDHTRPATRSSSSEVTCIAPPTERPDRINISLVFPHHAHVVGQFEYKELLKLVSVRPSAVDVVGGVNATVLFSGTLNPRIEATGFACRVDGMLVPTQLLLNESKIECSLPAHPQGSAVITIWEGEDLVSLGDLTINYSPTPVVGGISPVRGSTGGLSVVNIRGFGFVDSPDLACFFGDIKASRVKWLSSTRVQCISPLRLPPGSVHLTISNDGINFSRISNSSAYTMHHDLSIVDTQPFFGPVGGGTTMTRGGMNTPLLSGGLSCVSRVVRVPAIAVNDSTLECMDGRHGAESEMLLQITGNASTFESNGNQVELYTQQSQGAIHHIWPKIGSVKGGTTVFIGGANFVNATQLFCRFQGKTDVVDVSANWLSPSGISCTSPPWRRPEHAVAVLMVGTGRVVSATRKPTAVFDFVMPPLIDAIYPTIGPDSGGTDIHVEGANFRDSNALACLLCSKETNACTTIVARWSSKRELSCTSPRHKPGLTTLKVINDGQGDGSDAKDFLYVPAPNVAAISPTRGFVEGGTKVVIGGTNFAFFGNLTCRFGEVIVTAAFEGSRLTCTSPRVSRAQDVFVEVSVNGVDFTSDKRTYRYSRPGSDMWPISISPDYGDMRGGTVVTATVGWSRDFMGPAQDNYVCVFGDEVVPVISPSFPILCRSPRFADSGAVTFSLQSPKVGGVGLATTSFIAMAPIQIMSIEPASGWDSGGESVVVSGYGFADTALACCRFGLATTAAEMLSKISMRCASPPWSSGTSRMVVVEVSHNCLDFYGSGIGFQYRNNHYGPSLFSEILSHYGVEHAEDNLRCTENTNETSSSRNSYPLQDACSSHVDGVVEPVVSHSGVPEKSYPFGPVVLFPSSGPAHGGSLISVSGIEGRGNRAVCEFSDRTGRTVHVLALPPSDANRILCSAPSWPSPGPVMLRITSDAIDATGGKSGAIFMFYTQPILLSIKPAVGYEPGGTMLRIVAIGIVGSAHTKCGFFDETNTLRGISNAVWMTPREVRCVSPVLPRGVLHVEVSVNGVDFSKDSGLTYVVSSIATPTVFSIYPSRGTSAGGTQVTVLGRAFGTESKATCRFGAVNTPVTVVDANHMVCKAPPAAVMLQDVSLTDFVVMLDGEELVPPTKKNLQFEYLPHPTVAAVFPRAGSVSGGSLVAVTGHHFFEAGYGVYCDFGDARVEATVVSVNKVMCTSPPHDEGVVVVSVKNCGGDDELEASGAMFLYTPSTRDSTFIGAPSSHESFARSGVEPGGKVPTPTPISEHSASVHKRLDVAVRGVITKGDGNLTACVGRDENCITRSITRYMPRDSRDRHDVTTAGIQPDNGPHTGGTPVVVTGFFVETNQGTTCHFGDRRTQGIVVDATRVVCLSPPMGVQETVDFVMTLDDRNTRSRPIPYHYADVPTVSHLRPQVVRVQDSVTDIMIEGYGFRNTSTLACKLDNTPMSPCLYQSGSLVLCQVVQHVSGSMRLEVTNNGVDFSFSGNDIVFVHEPVVTNVHISAGTSYGDVSVLVSGLNFVDVPELACFIGGQAVSAVWMSSEKLRCEISSTLLPGVTDVAVILSRSERLALQPVSARVLPYTGVAEISSTPHSGRSNEGAAIIVSGVNVGSERDIPCRVDDVPARVLNESTIYCVAPDGSHGSRPLQGGGVPRDFRPNAVALPLLVRPTVESIHPSSGSLDGGTPVRVRGSGFIDSNAFECRFGDQTALSVLFISSAEVVCEAPPVHTPSSVPVTTVAHGVRSHSLTIYRYLLQAIVLDASPRELVFNDSHWLTISGTNFVHDAALTCLFNGTLPAAAQWLSPALLRCPIPPNLAPSNDPVLVGVSMNGVDSPLAASVIYVRPPAKIFRLSSAREMEFNGTRWYRLITVWLKSHSHRFHNHAVQGHLFCLVGSGSVRAVVTSLLDEECAVQGERPTTCFMLRCPAQFERTTANVAVQVVDGDGDVLSDLAVVSFEDEFEMQLLSPSSGPQMGGTTVTIHLGVALSPTVHRGGCRFSNVHEKISVEGSLITDDGRVVAVACLSPPWRTLTGQDVLVEVQVLVDDAPLSDTNSEFVYLRQATITAISPEWGTDEGGTDVRVQGIGFYSRRHITCDFATPGSALSSTTARWISDEELHCTSPAHRPGLSRVAVTSDGYRADGELHFLFVPSTQLSAVGPALGPTSSRTFTEYGRNNGASTGDRLCKFDFHGVPTASVDTRSPVCGSLGAPPGLPHTASTAEGERVVRYDGGLERLQELRIITVTPRYGWTTGGDKITFKAELSDYSEEVAPILCAIGNHRAPPISVNRSAGIVLCSSPAVTQTGLGLVREKNVMATLFGFTPGIDAVLTSSAQVFHYLTPITVTAVAPTRGQAGTLVRVSGEHFDSRFVLECQFGARRMGATFISSQMVSCEAPANETGRVGVTILTGGVLPAWHTGAAFTFESPILVFSISPERGLHGESTIVTVTGSGFQPSSELMCQFGRWAATGTFVNSTHIRCLAPPEGRGNVNVAVTTNGTLSPLGATTFMFDTEAAPAHVVPAEGTIFGGTVLSITTNVTAGTPDLQCIFAFDSYPNIFTSAEANGNDLVCRTPPSPGLRMQKARVGLTQGGEILTQRTSYAFVTPPAAYAIHPYTSHKRSGERLLVVGENFSPSDSLACKFSEIRTGRAHMVRGRFISKTRMSCITPVWQIDMTTGTYVVLDITANGIDFTTGGPGFVLKPMPLIFSVSPRTGSVSGGTAVTVRGASFLMEKLRCRFGTSFVPAWVLSDVLVICVSPPNSHGRREQVPFDLTVNNEAATADGGSFTYLPSVTTEHARGKSGQYFDDITPVAKFENGGEDDSRARSDLQKKLPAIARLEPGGCSSGGYMDILVYGSNFRNSASLTCAFGSVHVKGTFMSDRVIQCRAPQHAPDKVLLEISNDGATFSASGQAFTFDADPSILSVDPSHGPMDGSTTVTIIGNHFKNLAKITCRFGDVTTPGVYLTSNQMRCRVPTLERLASSTYVQVRGSLYNILRLCQQYPQGGTHQVALLPGVG